MKIKEDMKRIQNEERMNDQARLVKEDEDFKEKEERLKQRIKERNILHQEDMLANKVDRKLFVKTGVAVVRE